MGLTQTEVWHLQETSLKNSLKYFKNLNDEPIWKNSTLKCGYGGGGGGGCDKRLGLRAGQQTEINDDKEVVGIQKGRELSLSPT